VATTKTINTAKAPYSTTNKGGATPVNLTMSAETTVQVDGNGKYIPNSTKTTLYVHTGTTKKVVATQNAGERWTYTAEAGADLRKTLVDRNSMMNINLRNRITNSLATDDDIVSGEYTPGTIPVVVDRGVNDNSSASDALGGASIPQADPDQQSNEIEDGLEPSKAPVNVERELNYNIESTNVRTSYPVLFYPQSLATNKQDTIKFEMKTNEGSIINTALGQRSIRRDSGQITGSVTLPIPSGISDSNSVNFNDGELNAFQAFVVGGSLNLMDSPAEQLGENIGNIFGKASEAFRKNEAYGNALKVYLAQEATSTQGLLSRTTGAILNPNLELLFNKPNLREFSFVFKMSPRNTTEANSVRQIIRFFKQGMSVKSTADSTFLKSPNIFSIKYQAYKNNGVEDIHQSIGRIKDCALVNCAVNYTPDGSYMTYTDNERTLTSYEMALSFKELTPLTEDDYRPAGADIPGIGF
tara:strand:- start:735 stop:2144 length:1410 start_codon:yes stop_codon:yes gene_type:complete